MEKESKEVFVNKKWQRSYGRIKNRQISPKLQDLMITKGKDYILPFNNRILGKVINSNLRQQILSDNEKKLYLEKLILQFNNNYSLEIGFGDGQNLIEQAKKSPHKLFIGAEPFLNGVASLVEKISLENIQNIYIFCDDVRLLLEFLPVNSCNIIYILQPDPWPKIRHWKRRIINDNFIDMLAKLLRQEGSIILSTDHHDYTAWMLYYFYKRDDFFLGNDPTKEFSGKLKDIFVSKTKYMMAGEKAKRDISLLHYVYNS